MRCLRYIFEFAQKYSSSPAILSYPARNSFSSWVCRFSSTIPRRLRYRFKFTEKKNSESSSHALLPSRIIPFSSCLSLFTQTSRILRRDVFEFVMFSYSMFFWPPNSLFFWYSTASSQRRLIYPATPYFLASKGPMVKLLMRFWRSSNSSCVDDSPCIRSVFGGPFMASYSFSKSVPNTGSVLTPVGSPPVTPPPSWRIWATASFQGMCSASDAVSDRRLGSLTSLENLSLPSTISRCFLL
mmetsp:Transcript_14908/g.23593  ORF Transcript_14908/g.23593 Transcript_14908/m.23593 type:complete len:241 (-) Transcript_14908:69-791(-)